MTAQRFTRHKILWAFGALIVAGVALALVSGTPAQTKKTDPKTKTKDKGDKGEPKEAKVEPPPSTFPKRIDFVEAKFGTSEHVAMIDDATIKNWKENKTYPSDRCTDYEFIRRASLDIIGRIPTIEEINRFMKVEAGKRRATLIDALLDGPEYGNGAQYAQNFANLWTVYLMTRTGSGKHYQQQMNDWLYNHFKGNGEAANTELTTATTDAGNKEGGKKDRPKAAAAGAGDWSKIAYELIAGKGDTNRNAAVNYLLHNLGEEIKQDSAKNGKWDMVPATSRTTKLFLGIRTQCVQCHDHPFSGDLGQHHFWGINAFLRQVDTNGRPAMVMAKKKKGVTGAQEYSVNDNTAFNSNNLIGYERRNTVYLFTDPSFLDGKKIPKAHKGTRREALAKFITSSPYFAKSFVNRTWGHFFGKSFTKDNPDDFGEHNPVSHPDLLDKLSEDWAKKYDHDPKTLIRWICNSQSYGLSSKANKWNDKTDDETLFARMLLKPMTPEQMFESMMTATMDQGRKMTEKEKEDRITTKEAWFSKLVVNFGNDEGEEGTFTGTVIQALLLMNGQDINGAITEKGGAVDRIVQRRGSSYKSLPLAINDMYMATVNRPPTPKELNSYINPNVFNFRAGSKTQPTTAQFWTNYYQDVLWALLNSNEFILNH